ncbi:hypothetical protein CYMTET_4995 [Cymbomonas tetramitiformis]|uniref:VWFA domain-containing protein n=1 Tax=Cymbomonas tetramitiformis TaxID=36881 RepID=A0AAE0H1X6_9CHLO|nr:hypothetical protein CYMTET_4995 [Cymbomonas tetramitiformis]
MAPNPKSITLVQQVGMENLNAYPSAGGGPPSGPSQFPPAAQMMGSPAGAVSAYPAASVSQTVPPTLNVNFASLDAPIDNNEIATESLPSSLTERPQHASTRYAPSSISPTPAGDIPAYTLPTNEYGSQQIAPPLRTPHAVPPYPESTSAHPEQPSVCPAWTPSPQYPSRESRDSRANWTSAHFQNPLPGSVPQMQAQDSPSVASARDSVKTTFQPAYPSGDARVSEGFLGCPSVVCPKGALEPLSLSFAVECHISTAFVVLTGTWVSHFRGKNAKRATFMLPLSEQVQVTDVEVHVGDAFYGTLVVDKQEELGADEMGFRPGARPQAPSDGSYFSLPIPQIKRKQHIRVTARWLQDLTFHEGYYYMHLPTVLPQSVVSRSESSIINVSCVVNTGTAEHVHYTCSEHAYMVDRQGPGQLVMHTDRARIWLNYHYHLGYQVWSEGILASLNVQRPHPSAPSFPGDEGKGTFCLTVSPPAPLLVQSFARSVVRYDISRSMTGDPLEGAKRAVCHAIGRLNAYDQLNVVAYDDKHTFFSDPSRHTPLIQATPQTVHHAIQWVTSLQVGGLTDIFTPFKRAIELLQQASQGVPYIFLITDGSVKNERQICRFLTDVTQRDGVHRTPRVSTFGIGEYCNHYFMKQLATIGRGLCGSALSSQCIELQMQSMLTAMAHPVLTEIMLGISGLPEGCEMYPYPTPDLFCGHPIVVSGKFRGEFPPTAILAGNLPSGSQHQQTVYTTTAATMPLDMVFVRQRMDMLMAAAWVEDDAALRQQVIQMSIASGVPCQHTRMVSFETTPEEHRQLKHDRSKGRSSLLSKVAIGGAASVLVLGCAARGFGDVNASLQNLPSSDSMNQLGANALDPVADALSSIDLPDGSCCDPIADAVEPCGLDTCIENITELLDALV